MNSALLTLPCRESCALLVKQDDPLLVQDPDEAPIARPGLGEGLVVLDGEDVALLEVLPDPR